MAITWQAWPTLGCNNTQTKKNDTTGAAASAAAAAGCLGACSGTGKSLLSRTSTMYRINISHASCEAPNPAIRLGSTRYGRAGNFSMPHKSATAVASKRCAHPRQRLPAQKQHSNSKWTLMMKWRSPLRLRGAHCSNRRRASTSQ